MRVILERSNLLKSLNHVHRVVERRNTIPILSNVLLSTDGSSLELKATDLDLEVTEATPARIEQPGATPFRPTCSTTSCASFPTAPR
jgi:DNA polymerase-3 subunit beta